MPKASNLLVSAKNGVQAMADQLLMQAIGRLERAVSKLENTPLPANAVDNPDLLRRHDALKAAAGDAIARIDSLLAQQGQANG